MSARCAFAAATAALLLLSSSLAYAGYVTVRVDTRVVVAQPPDVFQAATGLNVANGPLSYSYLLRFDPSAAIARGTNGLDFDGQYLFQGGETSMTVSIGAFQMHTDSFRFSLWNESNAVRVGIFGQRPWDVATVDTTGFNSVNRTFDAGAGPLDAFAFLRNLDGFGGSGMESTVGLGDWYVYGNPSGIVLVPESASRDSQALLALLAAALLVARTAGLRRGLY